MKKKFSLKTAVPKENQYFKNFNKSFKINCNYKINVVKKKPWRRYDCFQTLTH